MRGRRGFPLFKYLFVEPTRTRRSGCAGEGINDVKKGAYLGLSNEGSVRPPLAMRSRVADPARKARVFNRHSVCEGQSELAAEFTCFLPNDRCLWPSQNLLVERWKEWPINIQRRATTPNPRETRRKVRATKLSQHDWPEVAELLHHRTGDTEASISHDSTQSKTARGSSLNSSSSLLLSP
jgi:hypothetical protein